MAPTILKINRLFSSDTPEEAIFMATAAKNESEKLFTTVTKSEIYLSDSFSDGDNETVFYAKLWMEGW